MSARIVACPHCGKSIEWKPENRFRPFCSERCRLIDLGAWASENRRIPGESLDTADDSATEDTPSEDDQRLFSSGRVFTFPLDIKRE